MILDLHCHSHFSDGALSPEALLQRAIDAKLSLLALTDHDTLSGLQALHDAADGHPIKIIDGTELSVRWKKYDIHILGLNIDRKNHALQALMEQQKESRIQRAQQIGECLLKLGIHDAYTKASKLAGHERVGRPHFAQVLIQEGLVPDMTIAFKRYLGSNKPAFVATAWVLLEDAVAAIVAAGGIAVIAHPLKYNLTRTKLHALITDFKSAGGGGLEVVSGNMTSFQMNEVAGLCHRFDLLASTGSDYHSDDASYISLGQQHALPVNCKPIWHQWNF